MSKVIDLTDFRVTESDNGETYVVLKKDFETIAEATHFESEIEKAHENRNIDLNDTRSSIKDKVMKYILKETGKKPVVLPVIIEIPSL